MRPAPLSRSAVRMAAECATSRRSSTAKPHGRPQHDEELAALSAHPNVEAPEAPPEGPGVEAAHEAQARRDGVAEGKRKRREVLGRRLLAHQLDLVLATARGQGQGGRSAEHEDAQQGVRHVDGVQPEGRRLDFRPGSRIWMESPLRRALRARRDRAARPTRTSRRARRRAFSAARSGRPARFSRSARRSAGRTAPPSRPATACSVPLRPQGERALGRLDAPVGDGRGTGPPRVCEQRAQAATVEAGHRGQAGQLDERSGRRRAARPVHARPRPRHEPGAATTRGTRSASSNSVSLRSRPPCSPRWKPLSPASTTTVSFHRSSRSSAVEQHPDLRVGERDAGLVRGHRLPAEGRVGDEARRLAAEERQAGQRLRPRLHRDRRHVGEIVRRKGHRGHGLGRVEAEVAGGRDPAHVRPDEAHGKEERPVPVALEECGRAARPLPVGLVEVAPRGVHPESLIALPGGPVVLLLFGAAGCSSRTSQRKSAGECRTFPTEAVTAP